MSREKPATVEQIAHDISRGAVVQAVPMPGDNTHTCQRYQVCIVPVWWTQRKTSARYMAATATVRHSRHEESRSHLAQHSPQGWACGRIHHSTERNEHGDVDPIRLSTEKSGVSRRRSSTSWTHRVTHQRVPPATPRVGDVGVVEADHQSNAQRPQGIHPRHTMWHGCSCSHARAPQAAP